MIALRDLWRVPAILLGIFLAIAELAMIAVGSLASLPNPTKVTNTLTLGVIATSGILIFLHIPEVGLGLFLFNGIFKTASVFGDPNSLLPTIFIVGLTTACLLLRVPLPSRNKLRLDWISGFLVFFTLLLLFSAGRTTEPGALEKALRFIFILCVSLIMSLLVVGDTRRLLNVFRYLALFSAITALLSVGIFMIQTTGALRSVTLFEANDVVFGRTLATGILMCFGVLLYDQSLPKSWRWLLTMTFPLMLISLLLSTSRGATVGLLVAIPFGLFVYRRRFPFWVWGAGAIAIAIAYLVPTLWGSQVIDLQGFAVLTGQSVMDRSTSQRLEMYQVALQQFLAHPFLGMGTQSNDHYPHNVFLEIASELGLVGLVTFLLLLWQLYNKLGAWLLVPPAEEFNSYRVAAQLIAIGMVYSLVIAQFSANLQQQRPLWLFVGLAWALPIKSSTNEN